MRKIVPGQSDTHQRGSPLEQGGGALMRRTAEGIDAAIKALRRRNLDELAIALEQLVGCSNALAAKLDRSRRRVYAAAETRRKLRPEFLEQVLALALVGEREKIIADRLGVGARTVSRATGQLRAEGRLVSYRRRRMPH